MQRRERERKGVFINSSVLVERRSVLQQLQNKREQLLQQLNALLAQKQRHTEQEVVKHDIEEQTVECSASLQHAQSELGRARTKLEKQRQQQAGRRAALEQRLEQLARERGVALSSTLPNDMRTLELRMLHAKLGLVEEQRGVVAALLDILPLRVMSLRSGSAAGLGAGHSQGTLSISLCGLRIPDSLATSPGWWQQQPQLLSAVLGYLLLLLDLLAAYVGGPLLHEGSFQGCTSVIWQQQSFWNRRPTSSNGVLPLFVEQGLVAGAVAPLANTLPLLPRPSATKPSGAWAMLPLVRAAVGVGSSSQSPTASPSATPGQGAGSAHGGSGAGSAAGSSSSSSSPALRQRHADLRAAFDMLQRSAACLVRDRAREYEGLDALPHSWSPFAWLTMLCSAIMQDDSASAPRLGGVLNAAAVCAALEAQAGLGGGAAAADGEEGEAGAAEEEGWDVVHTILPPPPSDTENVEQYARAMYSDGNAKGIAGGAGSGASAQGSQHGSAAGLPGSGGSGAPIGLGGLSMLSAARSASSSSAKAVAG
eukprot:CAMPEP_0202861754 /NCGR_PEP_ID=MMETSP1391-20130828/3046_1 /ASSEMBLY_ACC=CAM_ASM_000867 /TAXON_ID=1034604 /ORGANISM="Chlamydomonas leiostraca, Strain SAG 11-49" /LENGTH=536 /DNA_ID=CAMNT_0049541189 /DNA_START=43 /DNA_END=1649 /DNA_ORIENTATION=+